MSLPAWLAVADEHADRVCLWWLAPLFDDVIAASARLRAMGAEGVPVAGLSIAVVVLYGIALLVPWLHRGVARPRRWSALTPFGEIAALWLLTLGVVAYRFYALNRLLPDNVGEMTFYVIAASDLDATLRANVGADGAPWAPVGLLNFLLYGSVLEIGGATILTMRLAAAVMSVLVTHVLYYMVRLLGGPLAAIIAAAWYAASPVEMVWARHDMFPFNSSSPIVLGLAAATYRAITRSRATDWAATALLMAATHHLFASGFSGFLIPVGVLVWLLLFDRPRLWRAGWGVLCVVAGVGAWLAGRSLSRWAAYGGWEWLGPFDSRLGGRVMRGGGWEASSELWTNVIYVVDRIWVGSPGDVHQTPIAIFGLPATYVSGVVAVFFAVGLAWALFHPRRPAVPVLLSLLAASLLPGITSIAAAHRMAVAFPAICALAAMAAAGALRRAEVRLGIAGTAIKIVLPLIVLPAMFLRIGGLYFERPMAEPPHVAAFKAMRPFLTEGTLAVIDLPDSIAIDVAYQMFDRMRVEALAFDMPEGRAWEDPLEPPAPRLAHPFYRHTALRRRLPEFEAMRWPRAVYFLHEATGGERKLEILRRRYPEARITGVHPGAWRPGYDFTAVEIDLEPHDRVRP